MMCARLLKPEPKEAEQGRFYRASGACIDWMIAEYGRMLRWVLKHQPLTLLVAIATLALTVFLYLVVPKGFFPVQDTGVIQGISGSAAVHLVQCHEPASASVGQNHSARPGR